MLSDPGPKSYEPGGPTRPHPAPAPVQACPKRAEELRTQPLKLLSWNIGGKPVQDALTAIKVVHSLSDAVVCLQELPRTQAGWQTTKVDERYTLVQFRDDLRQWRGNGILFDPDCFVCLRRKANHVGVWVRLRHIATHVELWVGSARFSTGSQTMSQQKRYRGYSHSDRPNPRRSSLWPTSTRRWLGAEEVEGQEATSAPYQAEQTTCWLRWKAEDSSSAPRAKTSGTPPPAGAVERGPEGGR